MMTTTLSSLRSLAKQQRDNNDDNYDDNDDNKDVVIASTSKNNDDHDVVCFAPVTVAIAAADKGVICPCRCPLTLTLLHRRRSGDPLLSKPQSAFDSEDNDTLIASASKNKEDHVWSLSGLRTTVELPA
jgi:hypothetical protein